MRRNSISVERIGRRWAIKHDDGFLGFVLTEADACRLAETLRRTGESTAAVEAVVRPPEPAAPESSALAASPA